jgi:hypothetical protein
LQQWSRHGALDRENGSFHRCLSRFFCSEFFAQPAGVGGMLVCLQRKFVSGQMVAFAMGGCGGFVGVAGEIMKLYDSIVCAWRHGFLLFA